MNLWPTELFEELEKCKETSSDAEKKFRVEAYKPKYLGKWFADGLGEGLKESTDRVDKALDRLRYSMIDNSNVIKNNQIRIKLDEKENNNMATSFVNEPNPNYEEIKDILTVTSMRIDHSPYAAPTVSIDGYIPLNGKKEYYTMYKNKPNNEPKVPQCKGIIRRDKTTRVDWADDTRTIVILEDGEKDLDMFHTFCIAFTKKMLGSTTAIMNVIKTCDTDAVEAAQKKAAEEKAKRVAEETKALKERVEKANFEAAVKQKMFEERVFEEAVRRIAIQEERRMNAEAGEDVLEENGGISFERFKENLDKFATMLGRKKIDEETDDETGE